MKNISWEEFISLPIYGARGSDKKFEVQEGAEIVTLVKDISRIIGVLRVKKGVDFKGCSTNYIEEKINMAINDLKWLKNRVYEVEKLNKKEQREHE